MGVGIHGEPGRTRVPLASARPRSPTMLVDADPRRLRLHGRARDRDAQRHGRHAAHRAVPRCTARSPRCSRSGRRHDRPRLVGNYITSLDMAGCSLTVLKADDELLRLWDAPVSTRGLRWGV